jgi:hypothetical protein
MGRPQIISELQMLGCCCGSLLLVVDLYVVLFYTGRGSAR